MLPHKHFLISGAVMAPFAISKPEWILVSGLTSAVIDLDVVALVWAGAKQHASLREFKNPLKIYSLYDNFIRTIWKTGVLKNAMVTHLLFASLIVLVADMFFRPFVVPVAVGAVTHILSDLPLMKKAIFE